MLNSGFKVSRSPACPGSLKTTATRKDVHDLFRNWIKIHPVRTDKLSQGSPALVLLSKEVSAETEFAKHPDSVTASSRVKLVRYQQNPAPFWGPGTKAVPGKRKRSTEESADHSDEFCETYGPSDSGSTGFYSMHPTGCQSSRQNLLNYSHDECLYPQTFRTPKLLLLRFCGTQINLIEGCHVYYNSCHRGG